MERFGGSYAGGPKGRPTIRHIKIHEVPDATTEMTELPGGRADWSVAVASTDALNLRAVAAVCAGS
jgi:hypothetical protein